MGDKHRGLYPAFFRDKHKGVLKVSWIEIELEGERKAIEEILHFLLEPEFLEFQRAFNDERKRNARDLR